MNALARLAALDHAAAWLATADDAAVRQVGQAIRAWLDGGAAEPLERMLAVTGRGGVSARRALALADRDAMLRQAHRRVSRFSVLESSAAARLMAVEFERYQTGRWPRERREKEPPAVEPATTWWRILRANLLFPKAKRLAQILAEVEIQYPV
ncbi:hypothetical protein [Mesorhizobium sp. CO1-1-9]|uniref:hypothetical protein n=1 Tax=Mesorhizobium sp. CO1-1-9 TaxID=2876630 RepID=UPI001CCEEAEA|nr:hypothetical protein [Mesorhizobium sp. CO1-1-9]MBZ9695506.1 hypothetical protein [Mesorhizobium sp. CO1-1-9]